MCMCAGGSSCQIAAIASLNNNNKDLLELYSYSVHGDTTCTRQRLQCDGIHEELAIGTLTQIIRQLLSHTSTQ